MMLLICENERQQLGAMIGIFFMKSLCLNNVIFTQVYGIYLLLFIKKYECTYRDD